MIVKLLRYLRGSVTFEAESAFAQRLIAVCAKEGVSIYSITPTVTGFRAQCEPKAFMRVLECAKVWNVPIQKIHETGGYFFIKKHRWRAVLLAAVLTAVSGLYLSQCFVFRIDIEGNQQVTDEAIRTVLNEVGIDTFTFIPGTDFKMVREQVLLKLPSLSWMTVNPHGCRLEVVVAERRIADIEDQDEPCDIRAAYDGVIREMELYAGSAATSAGHTVEKGEILVHGHYYTKNNEEILTHAKAKIIAEVWFDRTLRIDLQQLSKEYTEQSIKVPHLRLFGLRIPLLFTQKPEGMSDVLWEEQPLTLFGREFPFGIDTLIYQPYVLHPQNEDLIKNAQEILENQFRQLEATEYQNFAIIERESRMHQTEQFLEMTVSYVAETNIAKKTVVEFQPKPELPVE